MSELQGPKFTPKEEYPNASNAAQRAPVAKGSVKKPLVKVLLGWLFADDVGDINRDVIRPALKDLAYNIITTAIYGDRRGSSNRGGYSQPQGYDYNYTYTQARTDYRNQQRVNAPQKQLPAATSLNDYKNIVLPTYKDGEQVISELMNLCVMYGFATISDLWQTVGITRDNPMESSWGWHEDDISRAIIKPSFGEWRIVLPEHTYLDLNRRG